MYIHFQIDYQSLKAGNAALNNSHIWGLIHFTSNYTLALKNRINKILLANRYDVDSSSVQITLDPTSKFTLEHYKYLYYDITITQNYG